MMQYDKRSASAKNRTKNFLAINKSLVSKNKSNYLPKINPRKEDEQKRNKFGQQGRSTRDKPKLPLVKAKGPSSCNNQQHNDTVTISRDYLEKLLKGATGAPSIPVVQTPSFPQPPAVPIPQQQLPYDHPMQQPSVQPAPPQPHSMPQQYNQGGGIYDHSQVPGLLDQQPLQQYHDVARQPTGPMAASNFPGQDTSNSYYSSDIMNTSCQESPRGGGTYHRGTTNRPLHPAMRSQIVFGGGPGWGGDSHQTERDEAKKRWLNELDEQVKTQNTHTSPVSVGGGRPRKDSYPPQMPPSVGHQHQHSIMNPPNPVSTAVPSQRDDIEVFQMKAHNVHNPTAVGGGASHVSVGLQQQMSPREYTEKKMKELEHRDYLLAQMEEKRRLKEEEKRAIEREAEIEERRMAKERERMTQEFEMEKEIQRRKKMEEANRIALLEQRIKMAEKSAIAAKEDIKKSKKVITTNQHNNNNNKHVAFNNHSKRYPHPSNGSGYTNEDNIPPFNTDEMYLEGVKTSIDLRSPSLHTIPISASQSDKSVTSPRNSHDKRHGSKGTRSTQKTSMASHHHHHMAMASNSQVSLYSSSSEEPVNAVSKRRSKPKPEPPSSGKPKPGQRESRIPRRTILRKQLGKSVSQNKSESESDGKASMGVSIATTGNRRTVAAGGHQLQQQQQMPNSVAKTRSSNRASSHKGPSYNRPSSNDSQENVRPHKNQRLTKAHSVPQEREVLDPLPQSRSPPVPAVAKRLKEQQTGTISPPVPAVTKRLREKQSGTTSPPVPAVTKRLKEEQTGTNSPPVPAVARCIEEGQFRTTSPPVPAVAKRIVEEKANKLKQNGGLSANEVKRQDNVLPDISVTIHDTPQTRQTKTTSSNQEFEFPEIAPAQVQRRKSPPNSQSSVPSLPPVPQSGVINHQPHISNGNSVVSHPLPPINQSQANSHSQSNGRRSTSKPTPSLPPLPKSNQHIAAATQAPLPPKQQQQYTVYSQNTIPSFDNNQSGVDPPTQSSVVQYVRAPSYPPDSDHVKPAVRRHHHHHREDRKAALRNAVCVLPTIAEVRSQEEMKESISNKSLTCHASCHTTNHMEVVEELLKLRQGIRSQMMSFHSRLSSVLPPER